MGFVQKDAFRTMLLSYIGMFLGYLNKGLLFVIFLTTDEIGLINLIVTVGMLFAQFSNLGSIYATWKYFPFFRNKEKRNYGFLLLNFLIVTAGVLIFSILTVLLKDGICKFYVDNSQMFVDYYYWIIPLGIANVYFILFENYLRSLYKNIISVFSYEFLLRLLTTAVILLFGFKWIEFHQFVALSCLLYFIPTLILFVYLVRIDEFHFSISSITVPRRFRRIMLKFSVMSYVNTLGALIVTTLDAMMIAAYIGMSATGVYTTVVFLVSAVQVPYRSLTRITGPLVAQYWKDKDLKKMGELYKKVSSVLLVISLSLFMPVWINRIELFSTLKPEFMAGIPVFLFLMIGRITDMYLGINGTIFTTSKKYSYDLIFTFVLIIIVYTLNLVLIPSYGISGAAISTCIAIIVYNIGRMLFVFFAYNLHPFAKNQLYVFLLFVANVILFELLPVPDVNKWLNVIWKTALFTLTFPGVIYYFNLEPEIISYVKKGAAFLKSKIS